MDILRNLVENASELITVQAGATTIIVVDAHFQFRSSFGYWIGNSYRNQAKIFITFFSGESPQFRSAAALKPGRKKRGTLRFISSS